MPIRRARCGRCQAKSADNTGCCKGERRQWRKQRTEAGAAVAECEGLLPPKHDAGTATRHYRAFWQRRCRAADAGAVLKPQGGNCAVLPLHRPACRALSNLPHLKLRCPLKFPSSQKAYARAFRARHMLFLLSHYKLIPPAPSDNNTPPTNSRRPHSFSCPGSGHTRAENRYTPCCLPL